MKSLIVVLCSVFVVTNCQDSSVIVIGSKYIRPKHPYTVGFTNPLGSNVRLKLALYCDENGFRKTGSLQLKRQAGQLFKFEVPDIGQDVCFFSAVNDGGNVMVNHTVELLFPSKTLSMFVLTDKPVYKPGDVLRFRVVVVDIAMKPAQHIRSVEINVEDSQSDSRRQWTNAKLHNGIFESSYRLPSVPPLGMWSIKVTAQDNTVENEKTQEFEVREYVLPKFVVKVAPSRILLTTDREISLNVASHYTFGEPVHGKILVQLFADSRFTNRFSHVEERRFDSSASFTFKLKDELLPKEGEDHVMVRVNVSLTEEFSRFTANVSKEFPVFQRPYKIALIKPAMYFLPGGEYFCKLSVKDHNGIPVDPLGRSITLKTNTDEDDVEAELNHQGIASFVLRMPDDDTAVTISADFEDVEYENIEVIQGLETTSNQYLQITSKDRIIAGRSATFNVNSNKPFSQLSYFVVSRGSILQVEHRKVGKKLPYALKLKLSTDMAPHARLLVLTTSAGQTIMDFLELDFESFGNEFEYRLDEKVYRPDQDIFIDVHAEKDSYVAFQAIDQGALLLGRDSFGLTKEHILEDLDEYVGGSESYNSIDFIHSIGLFSRTGLESGASRMRREALLRTTRQTRKAPVFLRTQFPESWLWTNFTMKNKATHELTDVVPDTITSWYVTGFALSPSRGLGLMGAPQRFTVGKTFYMIANLPYSIKRDEVALIQVTLFNFLGNGVTTEVTLFNKNNEIEFVDKSSSDPKRRKKSTVVHSHQPQPISFLIKAKKLGEIAIKIEAVNSLDSDGLEHLLRVTPESRRYEKTESRFINLPSYSTQTTKISGNIPRSADAGSTKIHLVIDPPFVAFTAQNLHSLFTLPTGAADLNLLTFVPNVVVLEYLKKTEKSAPTIEQKATDYLSSGYQNQLKYKHSNGAFGQWNPPKEKPSVFLTALVANIFVTASKHVKVDYSVIVDAFSWIAGKQKQNGCFEEDGEIIYPPMQDSSRSVALTAFVVAAVRENNNITSRFGAIVEKGVQCVANNFYSLTKTHDIALATYALSLAKHGNWTDYYNRLVQDSVKDDTGRYWNDELNVEIAGYALLTLLAQDNFLDALPIMQWLNSQRYSTGQFAGVHSTYVALKALGKMATYTSDRPNDYRVQVAYSKHTKTFDTTNLEPMKCIEHELPENERVFNFTFEGIGFGFLQVTYQYHQNIQSSSKPGFKLDVQMLSSSNHNVQNLRVCLTYRPKEAYNISGLALVEVYLPSGLVVHENAVRDISGKIKNTEGAFDNTAMFVYYSALDVNEVCFEVTAVRKFKIALHRPSYVVVYDTNDLDHFAIKTYEGKVLQVCDICDADDCKSMNC